MIEFVVFTLDEQRYALDLGAVDRVLPMVELLPLPNAPPIAFGVINLHGTVIPVLDLRRRLGLPPRHYGLTAHLLVARTRSRPLALPVDRVLGVSGVTPGAVMPPDAVLPGIAHVAGIVALPDGLLFIHDLDRFLSLEEGRQLTEALEDIAK